MKAGLTHFLGYIGTVDLLDYQLHKKKNINLSRKIKFVTLTISSL